MEKLQKTFNAKVFWLQIKFKIKDVHVPSIPGMFTTFRAKNVPLFVDADHADPKHYGKIMGYDKPIDFRWNHNNKKS